MAAHHDAGAIWLRRLLLRALRRRRTAGQLQRHELVGPGLLDRSTGSTGAGSNPTQSGAPIAAQFLTATEESEALAMLAAARALRDRRLRAAVSRRRRGLACRPLPESRRLGGRPHVALLLALFFARSESDPWKPTWIFREAYYQSMAYRLMVLGGAAASPGNNTYVVEIRDGGPDRPPVLRSREPQEICHRREAKLSAQQRGEASMRLGLPRGSLPSRCRRHRLEDAADFREPAQKANEPMVRIFEVIPH